MWMFRRNPARFLAPIALVAFAFVLYSTVQGSGDPEGGNSGTPAGATATPTASSKTSKKKKSSKKAKTYTVKSGDTPSGIAEKTGVSLETLQELNPDLDPSTLAPGQRIKLSE
jgi:LysM repeat protein